MFLDDLPMVSALAQDSQGGIFITLEHKHGQGVLLQQLPDGSTQTRLTGLDKPDGLAKFRDGVLVSQEGGEYPLLWWHQGKVESLFDGHDIEEVVSDAHYIYAIEDLKGTGQLLRYDPDSQALVILRAGLDEAEGVAICPDGQLFYSEKKHGWVKRYQPGAAVDPVFVSGLNAPSFLMCSTEGLWISEDATHAARLLFAERDGTLQVVLQHLRSAQTVLPMAPGRLLVAEQGRGRILEIERMKNGQ